MEIGETEACAKSMMEDTKGLGQKDLKGIQKIFLFDSWFLLNKS